MKLGLPHTPFLVQLAEERQLSHLLLEYKHQDDQRAGEADVALIASVAAGRESIGHLTNWSPEEEVLHRLFWEAGDCYSLHVKKKVSFQSRALQAQCQIRLVGAAWTSSEIPLHEIARAAGGNIDDLCSRLAVTRPELETFARAPFCVQIPALPAMLLQKGCWRAIMMRLAWFSAQAAYLSGGMSHRLLGFSWVSNCCISESACASKSLPVWSSVCSVAG